MQKSETVLLLNAKIHPTNQTNSHANKRKKKKKIITFLFRCLPSPVVF